MQALRAFQHPYLKSEFKNYVISLSLFNVKDKFINSQHLNKLNKISK
ncbi:hypothetical protein PESP_a0835 [Pseudoalteromonas espejiana DSM 9414]|nr:hypothetical protein PESP_a0835 [Pseudoalteromonas espejiana DSM 9414]